MGEKVSGLKVGDELAFDYGFRRHDYVIHKIDKITPTGRIKCGSYELNPDLTIRGEFRHNGPNRGELVTPEIKANAERRNRLLFIQRVNWTAMDGETLGKVVELIESARKAKQEDARQDH